MNRHHEVMDEISGILQSEDYEPERFQEMCYELAEEIDELREVIRACAAGPWCFDVENAPKDGTNILLYWQHPLLDGTKVMRYMRWDGGVWTDGDLSVTDRWLLAFAVPNPPQVAEDAADVHN